MNILLASKICHETVTELSRNHSVVSAWEARHDDLKRLVKDAEVLVFRSGVEITADIMSAAPGLKLLIRAGSGLDNLDLGYVQKSGIELQRIPEPGARAVAELAIGLMLALARQLLLADNEIRKGRWLKHDLQGYLLSKKTLGVVGCGNIGTTLGLMAVSLGMKVVACVANPDQERKRLLANRGIQLVDFESILHESDFLSLHVPLNDSTRHMIGSQELAAMKPGSYLINLARGGVVDEEALYLELSRKDRLAGAALDVHAREGDGEISPLAELCNVVLTPHIGATTVDTQREIGEKILDLVATFNKAGTANPCALERCNYDYQDKTVK